MNLALGAMGEEFEEHPQPGYHGHGNEALSHYKDQSVSLETSTAPPRLRFASCWSQCWTGSDRSFSLGFCFWFGFAGYLLVIALPDRGNQMKVISDELPDI